MLSMSIVSVMSMDMFVDTADDTVFDDIISISDIVGTDIKLIEKTFSSFKSSLSSNSYDFKISKDLTSFRFGLEMVEVMIDKVHICLTFDQDDSIDKEYFCNIVEF